MNSSLVPFYFGSLKDKERLQIEQQMLVDPVLLLDYLDLKREMENAETIAQKPSTALWKRLQVQIKTSRHAQFAVVFGLSLAAAASLLLVFMSQPKTEFRSPSVALPTLIDSGHEQMGVSNVL